MILSLFRKDPAKEAADALYDAARAQARRPDFYRAYGVEDSVAGRFELLALHVYLILRRLRAGGEDTRPLAQRIFDAFFADLDSALREMGVGDLSVGKRIRGLAESFYGRIGAYEGAVTADGDDALKAALARNVFESADSDVASALAAYVRAADASLTRQPIGRIAAGIAAFPDTDTVGASSKGKP